MILKHETYCVSRRALIRFLIAVPIAGWLIFVAGWRCEDWQLKQLAHRYGWAKVYQDLEDGWAVSNLRDGHGLP